MFTKHIKGFKLEKLTYKTEIEGKTTVVTDSLIVAKHFEIAHKTVLRTIRNIEKRLIARKSRGTPGIRDIGSTDSQSSSSKKNIGTPGSQSFFVKTTYKDDRGKEQPKILMEERAFITYVSNASSSTKIGAERIFNLKEDFIEEFFTMKTKIAKLIKIAKLSVRYTIPFDDRGHISVYNDKERLYYIRGHVTSKPNGNPMTEEQMELYREILLMPELQEETRVQVMRAEKNKKRNSKKSVPCKTAKEMKRRGIISEKEAWANGIYEQGTFDFS